jgi:hypothetical protein
LVFPVLAISYQLPAGKCGSRGPLSQDGRRGKRIGGGGEGVGPTCQARQATVTAVVEPAVVAEGGRARRRLARDPTLDGGRVHSPAKTLISKKNCFENQRWMNRRPTQADKSNLLHLLFPLCQAVL